MRARLQQHPLQLQPVGSLLVGPLRDPDACSQQPLGEIVANLLQLADLQQSRLRALLRVGELEPPHRVRSDERIGELTLERGDLGSQRATSCPLRFTRSHLRDVD